MRVPAPRVLVRIEGLSRCSLGLVVALVLAACSRSPADKLVGWPPSEEVVPYGLPEVVDTTPAPEVEVVELDVGPLEVDAPPSPPCLALVEHACSLWTPFADACREARTKIPDDSHPATREACEVLLAKHKAVTSWGNPCGRYARLLCAESGEASERCKSARARVSLLTERREWNACIADILWFEARTLRR